MIFFVQQFTSGYANHMRTVPKRSTDLADARTAANPIHRISKTVIAKTSATQVLVKKPVKRTPMTWAKIVPRAMAKTHAVCSRR
jgi:hypothetical protein